MITRLLGVLVVMVLICTSASADARTPQVIPLPRQLNVSDGKVALTASSRICVQNESLRRLAEVLASEVETLGGPKLPVAKAKAKPGDIGLGLSSRLAAGSYSLRVSRGVSVTGRDYTALATGTATLLQSLMISSQGTSIPAMEVKDTPSADYRGLMIDVARRTHRIQTLRQVVETCRFYKIRYVQLHLSDNEAFTFPSKAYPQLETPGHRFTEQELRGLEAYATARGVTIIPELEAPGHSAGLTRGLPELSCSGHEATTLCVGREKTMQVLDTLVGEICDVFKSSPYFHIGADEVTKDAWSTCKDCQAYIEAKNLGTTEELYRDFLVRMNEIVKKHGKKTIAWEGFARGGKTRIPKDIIVMVFESLYNRPDDLVANGYTVINSSWQPLYVVNSRNWTPEYIYKWNMYRWENWWDRSQAYPNGIDVKPGPKVLGAQMCAWEQPDEVEIPSLRLRLASMSERLWNPDAGRTFQDFSARLEKTDALLGKLLDAAGK